MPSKSTSSFESANFSWAAESARHIVYVIQVKVSQLKASNVQCQICLWINDKSMYDVSTITVVFCDQINRPTKLLRNRLG